MRTTQEVLQIIRTAFSPLRCEVELHDYDQRVRFRVFTSDDEAILRMEDTPVEDLQSGSKLKTIVSAAQARIEKKGFELNQWDV